MKSTFGVMVKMVRHHNRLFWRSPIGAFFTLAFPMMFLILFSVLFGNQPIDGGSVKAAQFYAPALAVFTAASATYTNLGMTLTIARDEGILKRWRGTPLPSWVFLLSAVISAVWIALIGVCLMLFVGVVAFGIDIEVSKMPAAFVTFIVGSFAFAALGLALSAMIKESKSAPAAAQFTMLPMAMISDIFLRLDDAPRWLEILGDVLPLKPFSVAFGEAFNPFTEAPAFRWGRLAVLALWGLVGLGIALSKFRWEPALSGSGTSGRSSRRSSRRATPVS